MTRASLTPIPVADHQPPLRHDMCTAISDSWMLSCSAAVHNPQQHHNNITGAGW